MRVLIVTNMYPDHNPETPYAGIFVKEQLESLMRHGVECDLFLIEGFKSKIKYASTALNLFAKSQFGGYDIIHIHYGLSGLFTLLAPFRSLWKRTVLTLHGGDILDDQGKRVQVLITKQVIKRIGKVITLNAKMNTVVAKRHKNYETLPCGVDTDFFSTQDNRCKRDVILFPGRKDRMVKNYALFQAVMNAYAEKYGEMQIIALDGFTREQVRDLMSNSRALLMTSISEGSPQSIKEALSCDLPVVSSDVGDVCSVVGSAPGTRIFQLSDPPDYIADLLHEAIQESTESSGARREHLLRLGLDNEQITKRLIQIYAEQAHAI
jgi:glycosyltransferase involved in cell wall biosynthesis